MSSSAVLSSEVSSSSERFTGRVKWFNNKAGYGFITVTDGPKSGTDVFVHHSSIKVDSEQYKYLVQGEYVDFRLSETNTSDHEFQAGEVCGIKGGKLMCETRHETRVARTEYRTQSRQQDVNERQQSSRSNTRPKSVRPPVNTESQGEWKQVGQQRTKRDVVNQTSGPSQGKRRGRPPKNSQ
jgi:CspA family cold shock protein